MKKDVRLNWNKFYLILLMIQVGVLSEVWASGGKLPLHGDSPEVIKVTGKVIDPETNQGLPGVAVLVKGTSNGTVTDLGGNYSISVDSQGTLVFSFVGYTSKEVAVSGRNTIDVTMELDIKSLEEVVVIGYGEMKRSDLTGSVVSMDATQIERTNKVDALSSLQGQVPGVVIQRTNNKPGDGGFNIRIRGASTIHNDETAFRGGYVPGQNPLFIVDGMFVSDISFLNPADIERMDVLKDASATAIYGSRGSNGVVIIKTKRGAAGKLTVRYNNYFGVKQATHLPPIMNSEKFYNLTMDMGVGREFAAGNLAFTRDDVNIDNYMSEGLQQNYANGVDTDWIDLISQNGFQNNHTVDLGGGNETTLYNIGLGYTFDQGAVKGEDFTRYNLRGNLSSDLTKWLNLSYSNYITVGKVNDGSWEGFRSAYRLKPLFSPYNEDGSLRFTFLPDEHQITNPLFDAMRENSTRENKYLQYLGDIALKVSPAKGLTITTKFSPNMKYGRYGEYRGLYSKEVTGNPANRRAQVNQYNSFSSTWDNIFNYEYSIGDEHRFNATFVYSQFSEKHEAYTSQTRNFTTDDFLFYNMDAGASINELTSDYWKQTLASYTGRLNYSLLGKYLVTVTGRYDGSSILAEGSKWAFFPSAALAWRLSDEEFMQAAGVVSDAKIRLSYGQTGNNGSGAGLGPLRTQSLLQTRITNINDVAVPTAYVTDLSNKNLTWERTTELNLGFDFGFVRNRVNGSLDVYNRKTTDIIFSRQLPYVTGFAGTFQNIGESTNKGVELALNTVNIDNGSLRWTTGINFAANRNRIDKLNDEVDEIIFWAGASHIHRVGAPMGSIYDYQFDGIWQMDEAAEAAEYGQYPGQVRVKDIDGDGSITPENDRTVIGNSTPKWTGGITNTLNYKNFDFSVFVYTSQGNMFRSAFHSSNSFAHDGGGEPHRLFSSYDVDYWTPDNPTNEWYQPGNGGPYAGAIFYRDVSYVRVGFISLGYTLPKTLLDKAGIGNLRVYAMAQNPFTFSGYDGWDPESASRDTWGLTFFTRTFMTGLNLTF